ncbi:MAG TPA: RidA family protein [Myxococcota bacterium]|jgi:enamine deaminase RidA (YjgF/YER057c/UK114 family)
MSNLQRLQPGKRLSQGVVHGELVYSAGIVADDPVPDAKKQTAQILAQIDRLLAEGGSDKSRILTATIWLSDIRHYAAMNEAWDPWVEQGNTPARACVEAKLAAPQYWVEIRVVAAR